MERNERFVIIHGGRAYQWRTAVLPWCTTPAEFPVNLLYLLIVFIAVKVCTLFSKKDSPILNEIQSH